MESGNEAKKADASTFQAPVPAPAEPLRKIILVAAIAAGVQFGWALQLSLLTPYVQLLGIPHTWASFIWLCGPVSGLVVQPIAGYYSDNCRSRYGRRRPFIAAGTGLVAVAVGLIGYAADIGHAAGDNLGNQAKPRAITVFVVGFWILDVANNTLQGPCRALLADMSGGCAKKMSTANALFSFFMAVGNVLGYAAGSYSRLYKVFPFSKTIACDVYCANLKSCFFIAIALLLTITVVALTIVRETALVAAPEIQVAAAEGKKPRTPVFGELFGALKDLPKPMWIVLLVMSLSAIALFPFMLFDTDWMGREVYGGTVQTVQYNAGVHAGSLGLMLNSVVLGLASLGIQFGARGLRGAKKLWGGANFLVAVCLAMTVLVTKQAEHTRQHAMDGTVAPPTAAVKAGALVLFAVLGIPFAVVYSVPYALASIFSSNSKAGQGLALGVLNLAIVIPQMFVSVVSGPWDGLFGGGNLPAFVVGSVAAAVAGVLALTVLPTPPADASVTKAMTAAALH